jgi:hypothetical protein
LTTNASCPTIIFFAKQSADKKSSGKAAKAVEFDRVVKVLYNLFLRKIKRTIFKNQTIDKRGRCTKYSKTPLVTKVKLKLTQDICFAAMQDKEGERYCVKAIELTVKR